MLGAVSVFLALIFFIVAHEAGHYFAAKATGMKVTEFFIGFGPKLWSFKRGETEYGIKPIPFGAYVKVVGMSSLEEVDPDDEGRTYREKPFWAKSVVVLSGVAANFLLAYLIFFGLALWQGQPVIVDGQPVPIPEVASVVPAVNGVPTAASKAGLQSGDKIVGVDGDVISTWDDLTAKLVTRPNQSVLMLLERDGALVETTVVLGERTDPDSGEVIGFLGVAPDFAVESLGLGGSASVAGRQLFTAIPYTYSSFGQLLQLDTIATLIRGLGGEEIPPEVRPSSVVGIVQLGAQAGDIGIANVIGIMALVNVFLGALNIVPLFPLDGGHFAVAIYEKVSGRRANMARLVPVAVTVVVIVGFIGILAMALDIFRPIDF